MNIRFVEFLSYFSKGPTFESFCLLACTPCSFGKGFYSERKEFFFQGKREAKASHTKFPPLKVFSMPSHTSASTRTAECPFVSSFCLTRYLRPIRHSPTGSKWPSLFVWYPYSVIITKCMHISKVMRKLPLGVSNLWSYRSACLTIQWNRRH